MNASIYDLLQREAQAVLNIPITDAYEKAVDLIVEQVHRKKGKLVTSGMGKAGQIAMNIATTFCSTGTPAVFLHPSEAQHGDLGILQEHDLLLLISNSGKTREIVELTDLAYKLNSNLKKIVITGNPVRKDLEESVNKKSEALSFFGFTPEKKTLLVVGGSLGARTINRSIQNHLDELFASGIQLIWQTGRYYQQDALTHLKAYRGMSVWCSDFIKRMDYAYAAAELVISRAGAGSISELCLLGKPVVLVPSPNVAEDHQTKNALALVENDAAIMVSDKDAEKELVATTLNVIQDIDKLNNLSRNIATLAHRHSADQIVDEVVRVIESKRN